MIIFSHLKYIIVINIKNRRSRHQNHTLHIVWLETFPNTTESFCSCYSKISFQYKEDKVKYSLGLGHALSDTLLYWSWLCLFRQCQVLRTFHQWTRVCIQWIGRWFPCFWRGWNGGLSWFRIDHKRQYYQQDRHLWSLLFVCECFSFLFSWWQSWKAPTSQWWNTWWLFSFIQWTCSLSIYLSRDWIHRMWFALLYCSFFLIIYIVFQLTLFASIVLWHSTKKKTFRFIKSKNITFKEAKCHLNRSMIVFLRLK